MRAVVQRVSKSSVSVDEKIVGCINNGLLVLIGVGEGDSEEDAEYLSQKILSLRIFEDDNGKMNKSVIDIKGEILIVSQFTLYGDCRKGTRPSFDKAEEPKRANELYEYFVKLFLYCGLKVETGQFMAMMQVSIINEGPVTLMLDSNKDF